MLNNCNLVYRSWLLALMSLVTASALAHGEDDSTRSFLQQNSGVQFVPFLYIGAKHMLTGYDHLLFLVEVIFFLYRSRGWLLCVTRRLEINEALLLT